MSNVQRRKKKLITPTLQLRLTGTFAAFAALAMGLQFLYLGARIVGLSGRLSDGGMELFGLVPQLMLEVLATSVVIGLPLFAWIGIHVTHRVAGPAYRLERFLREVAEGQETEPCRLRKGDELTTLCEAANLATAEARAANAQRQAGSGPVESLAKAG